MSPLIQAFFHRQSCTISYLVYDQRSGHGILIDSALDFDAASGRIATEFADSQLAFIRQHKLKIDWIMDTHIHADHLSAADYLRRKLQAPVAAGQGVVAVQQHFKAQFDLDDSQFSADGSDFDHLFGDGESFRFGPQRATVLATPGHTPESLSYLIDANAFVGDTLFMPDAGTARCDFPGGDAATLYRSIHRLHHLPGHTRLWICHDYQPNGRALNYVTTVEQSRNQNIHLNEHTTEAAFVAMRQARDATLTVPKLYHFAAQVNIRAGKLPRPEANGSRYLKLPISGEIG